MNFLKKNYRFIEQHFIESEFRIFKPKKRNFNEFSIETIKNFNHSRTLDSKYSFSRLENTKLGLYMKN